MPPDAARTNACGKKSTEHLTFQTDENLRAGMSPAEARRQAVLKLGAAAAIREDHHAEQSLPFIENLLFDLKYAVRMLLRSPGFAFIAIATMALGVGATTAIYSVIDATLLHPLPYPHASELVRIEANLPGVGAHDIGLSIPELKDLQNSGVFQYVSLSFFGTNNLTGSSQPTSIASKSVSPTYFAVLGVEAQLGRTFDPQDQTPGFNNELVISDGLWKSAFGGDPHILGKTLRVDNDPAQVVGVMPASFHDQGQNSDERGTDLWAAAGFADDPAPKPTRSIRLPFETIARLQPGLSPETAQAHVDALVDALKKQYPADYPSKGAWTLHITPLAESVVGNARQSLILLFGAVGLVLLISCVNVANLLLARASTRGREIAVRQALGAQRTRLIRQLLTEILLLFVLGGAAGFAILFCTRKFLLELIPESLPRMNDISINWGVLAFALALSVVAGIVFGLAPAWLMSRLDLTGTLRQEGRAASASRERSRARQILVIGELALSLVLMVAAGLLLRSFWDLFKVQLGFNPTRVVAVETSLPNPNDPKTDVYRTATQEGVFLREVLRRNRTIPGVEETAASDRAAIPLGHSQNDRVMMPLAVEGQEMQSSQPPLIDTLIVSPEYFDVLGMTLLRGRLFADEDLEIDALDRRHQPVRGPHLLAQPGSGRQASPYVGPFGPCPAGVDDHRRRHCRCAHRITRERRYPGGLPRHLPAPRQVSGVLFAWTDRSRRHLRASAHPDPVRGSGASRLPRGDLEQCSLLFAFRAAVLHGNGGGFCGCGLAARRTWSLRNYFVSGE